jgi:small subunit ribosomal protein S18
MNGDKNPAGRFGGRGMDKDKDKDRDDRGRGMRRGGGLGGKRRPKFCYYCVEKTEKVDYKDIEKLRKYISERGKIVPRRISGSCAKHQRQLTEAIKRARFMALLPFSLD